jgi:hypothetical protein
MAAFDYRQAEEIRDTSARHSVRYFFIGKSGAIISAFAELGFSLSIHGGYIE